VPGVWAIGDACARPDAGAQGRRKRSWRWPSAIAGQKPHVNFNTIPSVIYTRLEVAWVRPDRAAVKASGVAYKTGSFPFSANARVPRARAIRGPGQIHRRSLATDAILGVHIIGPVWPAS